MIFLSLPLGGRPICFDNMIHVKISLEISSYEAKLMPSLADGEVKIAIAAWNSFDCTDTKVSDFLTVRKSRAVESKIIDFAQSMLVNSRSLTTYFMLKKKKRTNSRPCST